MDKARADATIARVSWRILPLLGLAYLFAYMDRVNIGFAALQMNADLGFSATVYGLGGGLFFLSYALFEVPSNIFLAKFGARRWIARIMVTWGLLAAGMMFVQTPLQFYVMRFLLGMAEAGFFPGAIFYLSQWVPRGYRGRAISRFYITGSLAAVVMGAISGGLLALDGLRGLQGWQWLFLVQGLPSALVGLLVLRYLPDAPATADWLDNEQRNWLSGALAREAAGIGEPASHNVLTALRNPAVLQLGLFGLLTIGAYISLTLAGPLMLREATALDPARIGWIVSAGGLLGAMGILIGGAWSDRRGERFSVMLASTAVVGVSYLAMAITLPFSPALLIAAYLVLQFAWTSVTNANVMLWPDLLHPRQLAVGSAAINTLSQLGAFTMPFAWGAARDATGSNQTALYGLAVALALAFAVAFGLSRQVGRAERLRIGPSGGA
jgi:ACS family tartrate transporter-like MFS transporter